MKANQIQEMIDNYFERKQIISQAENGTNDELPLEILIKKIKENCAPGTYGDKLVSLVPRSGSPTLNYKTVLAGVPTAIWDQYLEHLVTQKKESVALTISLLALPDYAKSAFKIAKAK